MVTLRQMRKLASISKPMEPAVVAGPTLADLRSSLAPIIPPTMEEVRATIYALERQWDEQKFSAMLVACKRDCLRNITTPFGLGRIVASRDKLGGNITTQHNAEQKIFARVEEALTPEAQNQYRGYNYKKSRQERIDDHTNPDGSVTDGYTGNRLAPDRVDVDHVSSVEQMHHKGGGWMQSTQKRAERGGDKRNLVPTDQRLNRSMKGADIQEWMRQPSSSDPSKSNAEYFNMDEERVREALIKSREADTEHRPSLKDKGVYFTERTVVTGTSEAMKSGVQKALGLLLANFFENVLDEAADAYRNGFQDGVDKDSFYEALKCRLDRVLQTTLADWRQVLDVFKQGSIHGFISNFLTCCVNAFVTTSRRLVRIIREGWMFLVQAFKTLFSGEHTSLNEAADAALKIIISGVMAALGIIIEENVAQMLEPLLGSIPLLGEMAPLLSTALVGAFVSFCTLGVIYLVDKLDIFGVHRKLRNDFVIAELTCQAEEQKSAIDDMLKEAERNFPPFMKTS